MFLILLLLFTFTFFISFSSANVEKVVFVAEPSVGFKDLRLPSLHPSQPHIFHRLSLSTPDHFSWYLLEDLPIGQRFEVRVCWPATHPTKFDVDVFSLSDVLDSPVLTESLFQTDNVLESCIVPESDFDSKRLSKYFLRIQAFPEYVSSPSAVAAEPIPVPIDIILDPYILNILPKSLTSTAVYICITGLLSWIVAKNAYTFLSTASNPSKSHVD